MPGSKATRKPNALAKETSPYLLQHAHNPVDWYPWNEETLALAQSKGKMILVSIGYAACHWCHVMAHESFEQEQAASVMNKHFICIKVDREERPDVDQIYMDAAHLINGNGGWPLNALALPDGRPFFAGTYYQTADWIRLLEYFANIYQTEKEKLIQQAEALTHGIKELDKAPVLERLTPFENKNLENIWTLLLQQIDMQNGGLKSRVKFPMPSTWEFILQYGWLDDHKEAKKLLAFTLNKMANGGIYDQVGGGFCRYATDAEWHVPHFEKMLYDNSQLVSLYSHAFQANPTSNYRRIVYETLTFIERELTSPEGGFYSSIDADSEGEEGKFYVWTMNEIQHILGEDAISYFEQYHIKSEGNWEEGKNIPYLNYYADSTSQTDNEAIWEKRNAWNQKLLAARNQRIRPGTDDKILTGWNALMAKGYIDAYQAFGETEYFNAAQRNLDFLLTNMVDENHALKRNYKNRKTTIPAFLDDYAALIMALIDFYQASFEEKYLTHAQKLMNYVEMNFYDEATGFYFYTDKKYNKLIARKMELTDNVIPSSNSMMAKNLFQLGTLYNLPEYLKKSHHLTQSKKVDMETNPAYNGNWLQNVLSLTYPSFEIAITGEEWPLLLRNLQRNYMPDSLFLGGTKKTLPLLDGKINKELTLVYICSNHTCQSPVPTAKEAMDLYYSLQKKPS